MSIVIALCYLPTLALICGLSGVVAQGLVVKSRQDKLLADGKHFAFFASGALSGSAMLAAIILFLNGNSENIWYPLLNQIAASLLLPPTLGIGMSRLSIELAKTGAASSVALNRYALGIFQSIWLFPAMILAYTFPLRGLFSGGTGMFFAVYLPVFFVLGLVVSGLARLTLKPVFTDKFQ